jgi:hypothetical protein
MGRKKAPATPVNAAPNYNPNAMPAPSPFTAPAGGVPGWTPANPNGANFGPPPPQGERNPFLNAPWLWANGDQSNMLRPIQAKITGIRAATGGNPQYANRGGWFLDCILGNGSKVTARVNVGDNRHQRLYARFQNNLIGQTVTFRLSHPGDNTKAPWTVE